MWTVETLASVATAGRVRAVGQVGAGLGGEVYSGGGDRLGVTGSVAGGIMSRFSGSALLLRLEGGPYEAAAVVMIEFGRSIRRRGSGQNTSGASAPAPRH